MKTLIIYNTKVLGISDDEVAQGDVVEVPIDGAPTALVVYEVIDAPTKFGIGEDGKQTDIEMSDGYEKIAYLILHKKSQKTYKKKTSQKLEKRMAKSLDGNTTVGSGAFSGHKGDVKSKEWLGEHKYTDATEYRLQLSIWNKIKTEAHQVDKTPILEVVLDQTNRHIRLMFMSLDDFYYKTRATEDQLLNLFYFMQYKPKAASVLLKADEVKAHIDTTIALDKFKVPGIFVTFDKQTLFGILAKDFERVFQKEIE
jgi:hypothetical protein